MPGQGVNQLPGPGGMMQSQPVNQWQQFLAQNPGHPATPTTLATGPRFDAAGHALRTVPGTGMAPGLPGGPQAPNAFMTPVGPMEQFMNATLRGGPGGNAFMNALANGQVPPGMLQQYKDLAAQNQAQIADSMGGSRFGSDYAGAVTRENNRGLTNLLAGTEQMGQNAFSGLTSPLLSSELGRSNQAMAGQQSDFQNQQDYPMKLLSLLLGFGGMGGGSTSGTSHTNVLQENL